VRARTSSSTSPPSLLSSHGDGLFDFPLPIPAGTAYDELGIDPESPPDEIGWAVKELNDRRKAECAALEQRVTRVFSEVPGLEEAYKERAALRETPTASSRRLRRLEERVVSLEKVAAAFDPQFQDARRRVEELKRQVVELNLLALDAPKKRKQYDELHPPLALLKLVPAARDQFIDKSLVLLTLVRREITRFLRAQGEAVYYASDLDRDDFTADFTFNPLLDAQEKH
jgi:hypothetical protein